MKPSWGGVTDKQVGECQITVAPSDLIADITTSVSSLLKKPVRVVEVGLLGHEGVLKDDTKAARRRARLERDFEPGTRISGMA